ncbi:MAG: hypothetical protein ACRCTJ_00985, partial [Brevinema sp.]
PKTFSASTRVSNMTYVVSTEAEKNQLISNINTFSGHYSNFSGNLTVESINEEKITQTSLFVLKNFSQEIGTQTFNYEGLELSPIIHKILDPTIEENKDPKAYKQKISNFLDSYGYFYVSAYTLYGNLSATWSIETESIQTKNKLSIDLGAKISSGKFSFEDVNKFINETTSSYFEASTRFTSQGVGVLGNTQTIEQIDEISKDFTSNITEESAAISKVYISPWITLPQVTDYLLLITDKQLHDEIKALFNGTNLTQDIWDRSFSVLAELKSMDTLISDSVNDPYNNLFWGSLVDYNTLPIKEIQNKQSRIREFIDIFSKFEASTFGQQFQEFQNKHLSEWSEIKDELRILSTPSVFSGIMSSGFFEGDDDPTQSKIYKGVEQTLNFDLQKVSLNTELMATPISSYYLPVIFTNVWTQGVVKFVKNPVSSKTVNPFSILIECRTSWTLHTDWEVKIGNALYYSDRATVEGNANDLNKYAGYSCFSIARISLKKI